MGKLFIPPMKQISVVRELSYIDDMLPELVWLGLIYDRLGYIPGTRFFEKIVSVVVEVAGEAQQRNYAFLSHIGELNSDQRLSFVKALSAEAMLEPLREYIAPLVLLYDDCPLAFIGPPDTVYAKEELVNSIKTCVGRHLDKYDTPGTVLNATMLIARLVTGTIKFSKDTKMPDFNMIVDDPSSAEANLAAGFVRANALAEFGMLKIDNMWARSFWNKNIVISECEFEY